MLNKKILLFAALLILLAGVVSANEVSDDVTADSEDAMEVTQDMPTPQETIGSQTEVETNRENNIENKTIEKTLTKQYTTDYKQADDTTEVNSYTKLKNAVDSYNKKTGVFTISLLPGNYNATETITWSNKRENTKLIIEGNNLTINGLDTSDYFINTDANTNLELNNIRITNFNSSSVHVNGNLVVNNSIFEYNSRAIFIDSGVTTVIDSAFKHNGRGSNFYDIGSAILINNNNGQLKVISSTFNNNFGSNGGAIINYGTADIVLSTFNNNIVTDRGGAIENEAVLKVDNCNFTFNQASGGGAISTHRRYGKYHRTNISNSIFKNNSVSGSGGAIFSDSDSFDISFTNFTGNTAGSNGGAIYSINSMTLNHSVFVDNKAEGYGGALFTEGSVIADYSNFTGNVVGFDGGAISSNSVNLNNSKFTYNVANQGGALNTRGGSHVICNCEFTYNSAIYVAGAIRNIGDMTIYSSNFTDNNAAHSGAVHHATETLKVYDSNFISNCATVRIGALYNSAILFVNNCVFIDNSAPQCGALYNNGTADVSNSLFVHNVVTELGGAIYNEVNITVTNSTFNDNIAHDSGPIYKVKGTVKVFSSTFAGNSLDNFVIKNDKIDFVKSDGYISVAGDVSVNLNFRDKPVYMGPLNEYTVDQGYMISLTVNGSDIGTFRDNVFIFGSSECHVYGYDDLVRVVKHYNERNFADCTIYLEPGDYNATDEMLWGNDWISNRKLSIEGNGLLLDGNGSYMFMNVSQGHTLELNNVTLNDYFGLISVIINRGNVSITNSNFTDNSALYYSPIWNVGNLFITDSYFYNNTALLNGGVVYNSGNLTANNSNFTSNVALNNGGVIYGDGNITVNNSNFRSNFAFSSGSAIYKLGNGITKVFSSTFTDNTLNDFVIKEHKIKVNNNYVNVGNVTIYLDDDNVTVYEGELDAYEVPVDHKIRLIVNGTDENTFSENEYLLDPMPYDRYVTNYTELMEAVEAAKSEGNTFNTFYISLYPGNYTATDNMAWENTKGSVHTLCIEGNGQKLDGNNTYQFMKISQRYSLVLNNVTLTNYTAESGGSIINYGNLSITGSEFIKNNAVHGGAIYNTANAFVTIADSNFTNNNATQGGAVYNDGNITINGTIFDNNTALVGGAIYKPNSKSNVTVFNSTYVNNKPQNFAVYNNTVSLYYSDRYITDGVVKVSSKDNMILINVDDSNPDKFKDNTFIIPKDEGTITYETIPDNKYKDNVTITGKFLDSKNRPVYNATIRITVNGENHTNQTDVDGTFNLHWNANRMGKNTVKMEYMGDYYTTNEVVTEFNTDKQDVKLSIDTIPEVKYHDYVTITGKLVELYGNPIADVTVNITVNDVKYSNKTDSNGVYAFTTATDKIGTNKVTVTFEGNDYDNNNTVDTTFKVVKQDVSLSVDTIKDVKYHDNVTITGKLLEKNGNPIKNAVINITVNSRNFTAKTDAKGVYKFTTATDTIGSNKVTVTYGGSTYYNKNSVTATFKVLKQDVSLSVDTIKDVKYHDNVTITGKLLEKNKDPIKNAVINITVNSRKFTAKTDAKGVYKFTTATDTMGTNKVTVTYGGSTYYNKNSVTATFKVLKQDVSMSVDTIKDVRYQENVTITGKLLEKNKNPIKNAVINITINSRKFTAKTDSNGVYKLTTAANTMGINNVTVSYNGNKYYNNNTKTTTFNVVKRETTTKATVTNKIAANTTIKIVVNDKATGQAVKSGNVEVINARTNKVIAKGTLKSGTVSITTDSLTGGTYNLTVKFKANTYYKESQCKLNNIKIEKRTTKTSATTVSDIINSTKVKITVTDQVTGKKIAGAPITIKLPDGKTVETKTNKNGEVTQALTLPAGKNTLNIKYTGSDTYKASTATHTINVRKLASKITVTKQTAAVGDTITLTAKVTDNKGTAINGGKVIFKLNNVTLKDSKNRTLYGNVKNGKASINYTIPVGYQAKSYNLMASYEGNSYYNSNTTATVQLTLKQRQATVTVTSNDNIKVNDTLNIKFTLKDSTDANRKINGYCIIKIDGKTLKDKNNNNIQVKITNNRGEYNYKIPYSFTADKHNITVVVVNSSYTKTQASKDFNIALTNTKIKIGTLKMTAKNTVLKATITDDKGNAVKGTNIIAIKLNGKTLKDNSGNNLYYNIKDGKINLTLPINSTGYKKQSYTFEIVMGANNIYNGTRVTTTLKNTQAKS